MLTFSGTVTNGSPIVTGIPDTAGLVVGGMVRDWTDAPNGFRLTILSKTATTVTLSGNVTGSRTLTLYYTPTQIGLELVNVAHGKFFVNVRDIHSQAVRTEHAVLCDVMAWCTSNRAGFNVDPTFGIFATRNVGLSMTTACRFLTPIIEGTASYGIRLEHCVGSEVQNGTSENNGGGVLINVDSENNVVRQVFMEGNGSDGDISVAGKQNRLEHCRAADGVASFSGAGNEVVGCFLGSVTTTGVGNIFDNLRFRTGFANSGTNTVMRSVRSEGGTYEADRIWST